MYDQDATGDARACRRTKDMYRENSLYNFGFSRGGPRWPPRHGYGAPLALKQGLDFSKAPLRGAVFLLPWVRAKKKLARGRKNGVEPGFEPDFCPFSSYFSCEPT